MEIPARGEIDVEVKTKEILNSINLNFEVLNAIVAPKKFLQIEKNIIL